MQATLERLDGTSIPLTIHKRGEFGYLANDPLRWILVLPDGYERRNGDQIKTDLIAGSYMTAIPLANVVTIS